jgi:hypothetical protein
MRLWFAILLILITTSAYAAPEVSIITINQNKKPSKVILSGTKNGYETNEPISSDQHIRLKFQDRPYAIEMREIYTGAISDDGPWQDVPQSTVYKKWSPLKADTEISIFLDIGVNPPNIKWPKEFKCPSSDISANISGCDDSKRWVDLYQQCRKKNNSDPSPCYTYQSGIEVRVKYKKNDNSELIRFTFPGGC